MSERPAIAFKVLSREQMAELEGGVFAGSAVDRTDGFIHLSTAAQLDVTVDKHFAGQVNLHVAAVDLAVLGTAVKWEPSRGGDLFAHIYGPLPLSAVIAYSPMERDGEGKVKLPVAVK